MQVLVVLADSIGHVVTRDLLFERCWGGIYVGDDSLNRAIGAVRKLAVETANASFTVETVPRTGYKLNVLRGARPRARQARAPISRRDALIAGGVIASATATGLWWHARSADDARFATLLSAGEKAVRSSAFDDKTVHTLEAAVSLQPNSAKAWGLLAFVKAMRTMEAPPNEMPRAVEQVETAARTSLAIDANEPNALLAMFELQGSTLDWITRDRRLRQIIATDPRNLHAINELVLMLQAAGLNRESWNWNERALAVEPLSSGLLGRRALKLWIAGRVPQADKVVDQARALWPSDPWLWGVQFLIFAFSGRPRAAMAMRDTDPASIGPPQEDAMWRPSLAALAEPSAQNITAARAACFKGATMGAQLGGEAVMILAALGEVDAAFDVAEGFLLSRGSIVRRGKRPFKAESSNDASWRINTQWLFVPPAAVMRSDPRFMALCEGVGLSDYWRKRGVRPDYLLT